ncbi:unnamed protein product [Schistosoma rodhaini]|uniref:Uncharacterized protein n=1 Tax=Schistosoma rodhaini TaxID=6188 RepID=A0AA85G696_9TREM|nr:unnamed protein product [Schistosoma rodhaini]
MMYNCWKLFEYFSKNKILEIERPWSSFKVLRNNFFKRLIFYDRNLFLFQINSTSITFTVFVYNIKY